MPLPWQSNMILSIQLSLSGQQNPDNSWTIHPVYSVINSVPLSQNVVTSRGAIDLTKMAKTEYYSNTTVITVTISSTVVDKHGMPASVTFPDPRSLAVQFKNIAMPGKEPIKADSEFFVCPIYPSPQVLIFTDIDNSEGCYEYCLNVSCVSVVAGSVPALIPLDPPITNRAADN